MLRCEEDLWLGDNLQIYACGLSPMLSKLVEILPVSDSESTDIVWLRMYLKACSPTDKDKRSTRTVSQRSGQIVLEGWLQCTRVGAGDGSIPVGSMCSSLKLVWPNDKDVGAQRKGWSRRELVARWDSLRIWSCVLAAARSAVVWFHLLVPAARTLDGPISCQSFALHVYSN